MLFRATLSSFEGLFQYLLPMFHACPTFIHLIPAFVADIGCRPTLAALWRPGMLTLVRSLIL